MPFGLADDQAILDQLPGSLPTESLQEMADVHPDENGWITLGNHPLNLGNLPRFKCSQQPWGYRLNRPRLMLKRELAIDSSLVSLGSILGIQL